MVLEKETEAFVQQLAELGRTPIYQLPPDEARAVLEELQSGTIEQFPVTIEELRIQKEKNDSFLIQIIRPSSSLGKLPVIIYFHGAGWVMGSFKTHRRLVSELAVGAEAAVVFVNYSRSPEAQFPVAIEEAYLATQYISEHALALNLDAERLVVAGDSVGGNMAIAVTQMAKEKKGPKIRAQVLFYPVTDADLTSPTYKKFAEGPWLTQEGMNYFWSAYQPDAGARSSPLLSPLRSDVEQLIGLPDALIITAENDVLRYEGEAYAAKLMESGVEVTAMRILGTIHDFMMLNSLSTTPAARNTLLFTNNYLRGIFNY